MPTLNAKNMVLKTVHCKREKYDVYIGRPSKWGNPFTIGPDGDRVEVINKYAKWILTQSHLMAALPELKGKVLGCWCAPKPCHGDVLIKLANKESVMPTLNAKGKKFYWSYSALSSYEQCPAKYAGTSFYCNVPWKSSPESIWGNRVHKSAENKLKGLPVVDHDAFTPVEPYVSNMLSCGHPVEAELEVTLTSDFTETSWFAKDAWLRCKIDVLISKGTTASQFDWKTGGTIRDNPDQLHLCDAALSTIRPQYEQFEGRYIWTQKQAVTPVRPLTKDDIPGVWADFLPRVARMEDAWDRDHFPPRPSGLCPWCQVQNCKQRQGEMRR